MLRTNRVRADTTVVPANVAYPTDSGLLAKAIRRIAVTAKRIQAAGGATRTKLQDRSRAAGKRAHAIAAKLRGSVAAARRRAAVVRRVTGELAELAVTAVGDAGRLLVNAKRALRRAKAKANELSQRGGRDAAAGRRRGRLARAVNDLTKLLDATRQIVGADPATRRRTSPRMGRHGGSACMMPMPARSPRAGSGGRSNSATRPRSSTTTTGSSWITLSSRAIRPTRRNWPRRCGG